MRHLHLVNEHKPGDKDACDASHRARRDDETAGPTHLRKALRRKPDHVGREHRQHYARHQEDQRAAQHRIELLPEQRDGLIRRMAHDNRVDQPDCAGWDEPQGQPRRNEQHGENRKPLPSVRQSPAEVVTERQRNQYDANLADPHVEGAAKVLGQETRADDFEDHDNEAAQKDHCCCCRVSHALSITATARAVKAREEKRSVGAIESFTSKSSSSTVSRNGAIRLLNFL